MISCQNCGKLNTPETHFCRFCGTKFLVRQPIQEDPFDHSAPRPYAWKTDEFQTQAEARKTDQMNISPSPTDRFNQAHVQYSPAPLAFQAPQQFGQPFRCPHCMSQLLPRIERRVSTAGWVTFAVLLVFFFPLFWIGLLIKEDVQVCTTCDSRIA